MFYQGKEIILLFFNTFNLRLQKVLCIKYMHKFKKKKFYPFHWWEVCEGLFFVWQVYSWEEHAGKFLNF